jgi:hypothetical protein
MDHVAGTVTMTLEQGATIMLCLFGALVVAIALAMTPVAKPKARKP